MQGHIMLLYINLPLVTWLSKFREFLCHNYQLYMSTWN